MPVGGGRLVGSSVTTARGTKTKKVGPKGRLTLNTRVVRSMNKEQYISSIKQLKVKAWNNYCTSVRSEDRRFWSEQYIKLTEVCNSLDSNPGEETLVDNT